MTALHKTNVTGVLQNKKTTSEIGLNGHGVTLDLSGAMYFAGEGVLLVADLHFEKGSAFAKRGMFLPPYDTRETLAALSEVVARFDPRTVIALGDSFSGKLYLALNFTHGSDLAYTIGVPSNATPVTASPVPVPGGVVLIGSAVAALAGLGLARRRRAVPA